MIPDRRLGQHFLTDPNLLRRIVDALAPAATDVVLEIGPGQGSLTAHLAPRVARVIAIERDRRLAALLRAPGGELGPNVAIVQGDALRLDWHKLAAPAGASLKVIGNIPYRITSPLIAKALTPPLPERVVFLVQAEVADRVAARPGAKAYGALSIGVQALCRVERLFTVRAGAFHPPPKVRSALLRLTPRAQPLVATGEVGAFRTFVARCFSRRRKQLRNVVMAATGAEADTVVAGLAALGLDPAARPETLPPEAFVRLWRWSGRLGNR